MGHSIIPVSELPRADVEMALLKCLRGNGGNILPPSPFSPNTESFENQGLTAAAALCLAKTPSLYSQNALRHSLRQLKAAPTLSDLVLGNNSTPTLQQQILEARLASADLGTLLGLSAHSTSS